MNFFDLHFSFPTACLAAGLKHDTGAKWIKRGCLVMRAEDREVVGRGGAKMLTARTTLQFLLGAELNRQGLSPYDACEAALCFSHEGDFKGQLNAKRDRSPGHLYPELPGDGNKMRTWFLPNREKPMFSKVELHSEETPISKFRVPPAGRVEVIDLEIFFMMNLGKLGVDVHSVIKDMKDSGS